jgi:excisionase family DNA binding protein
MTVSQTTLLLRRDQAAEAIGATPIATQRLIARGRLKATRLGADGDYRILASDIDKYVAGGAPDFDGPKLDNADGNPRSPNWFDTPSWPSRQVASSLAGLASQSQLSDAEFERRAIASAGSTIFVDVPLTAQMKSVLGGPVEDVAPLLPSMTPYAAKTAFDYWAADQLQSRALSQIDALPSSNGDGRTRIWKLYDSPAQYQQIVDATIKDVLQQSLFSASEFRARPAAARSGPGDNAPVQVVYRSRVSDYANAQTLRRIADGLAF